VQLAVPAQNVTEMRVTARLLYRKIDQFLLNFLFGEKEGVASPITVVSEDAKTIVVNAQGAW
jgi:hypothetical protein